MGGVATRKPSARQSGKRTDVLVETAVCKDHDKLCQPWLKQATVVVSGWPLTAVWARENRATPCCSVWVWAQIRARSMHSGPTCDVVASTWSRLARGRFLVDRLGPIKKTERVDDVWGSVTGSCPRALSTSAGSLRPVWAPTNARTTAICGRGRITAAGLLEPGLRRLRQRAKVVAGLRGRRRKPPMAPLWGL